MAVRRAISANGGSTLAQSSSASIHGGSDVPTEEITAKINAVVTDLLDTYQSLPPLA